MPPESHNPVDLRKHPDEPELREEVIESRRKLLLTLGFSEDFVSDLEKGRPTLYPKDNVQEKMKGLKERGFKDPVKMITKLPTVLNLGWENIDGKIEGLKERGFKDPVKMITSLPTVLGYGWENIDGKIEGLKERGFKDPVKIITSLPTVLGLGWENIDGKIEGLKERGFKDPVKMITSLPTVLSYSWENIDGKIKMLRRLIAIYGLSFTATEAIEKNLSLLGTKIDKLWVLARITRETAESPEQIDHKLINKLLFSNLENVILASRTRAGMAIREVITESKRIKKQGMSKTKKRERIANLPANDKVKQRYFMGYPMKKQKVINPHSPPVS